MYIYTPAVIYTHVRWHIVLQCTLSSSDYTYMHAPLRAVLLVYLKLKDSHLHGQFDTSEIEGLTPALCALYSWNCLYTYYTCCSLGEATPTHMFAQCVYANN